MTKVKISTTKPDAPRSRFDVAQKFAAGESTTETPEVKTETTDDMPTLKPKKNTAPTMRENFDLDVELGKEMRRFILEQKKIPGKKYFKTKREFLIQCLRDGLEKYKDE